MIINHNLNAMNAHRQMGINNTLTGKSIEKLSSGLRINRAGDDAAGLAISEKMRGQIRGLDQASRNAQDGISLIQTAEGALNETHSILQRMRELAVQSANDTNVSIDRGNLQKEFAQLQKEITRIAEQTEFNTKKLINGDTQAASINLQIGANQDQFINLSIGTMTAESLGVAGAGNVASVDASGNFVDGDDTAVSGDGLFIGSTGLADQVAANVSAGTGPQSAASVISSVITRIDAAINKVSGERAVLGANQNRLEHTIANVDNASENLQSAESRIRDVDMAKEMMNYTRTTILTQAAQSMLAQANQAPQGVLELLR